MGPMLWSVCGHSGKTIPRNHTGTNVLEPVHTSTIARFGPVRYDIIHNVNAPSIEPNRTLPNRTSPVDTTEPARYGYH